VALSVYVHDRAVSEAARYGLAAEQIAAAVRDAIDTGLERTAGTRWRALSTPYGCEYRLRRDFVRVVCSIVGGRGASDAALLFIHQIDNRDDVYEDPQFEARLAWFHERIWDRAAGSRRASWSGARYTELPRAAVATPEAWHEYELDGGTRLFLSGDQLRFVHEVGGSLRPSGGTRPSVILGHGPPGSGKTVVVQEIALEAAGERGCDVLALVPTARLRASYRAFFEAAGLDVGSFPDGGAGLPTLAVDTFYDFFAGRCAYGRAAIDRERHLHHWWDDALLQPEVRAWSWRHGAGGDRRFRQLVDAFFGDRERHRTEPIAKDAWHAQFADLIDAVADLEGALGDEAHAELYEHRLHRGLKLRWELAAGAERALLGAAITERPLLVLVDEAQDLIPREWQLLARWCVERSAAGKPSLLVLHGDANQRIVPTAFTWTRIKQWVRDELRAVDPAELQVARDSFRLSRPIRDVAALVFDRRLAEVGKDRVHAMARAAELEERGRVVLCVVPDPETSIRRALEAIDGRLGEETRLAVIVPDELAGSLDAAWTSIDCLRPAEAKGLEFDSVIVLGPFRRAAARGDARLLYDEATECYTALTRARANLLCILDPSELGVLERVPLDEWSRAGAERVPLEAGDDVALREMLSSFADRVSVERRLAVIAARIDALVAAHAEGELDPDGLTARLIDRGAELLALERPDAVVREGAVLLDRLPWLSLRLREAVTAMHQQRGASPAHRVAHAVALLLLGEIALAAGVLEEGGEESSATAHAAATLLARSSARERLVDAARRSRPSELPLGAPVLVALALDGLDERIMRLRDDVWTPPSLVIDA
jgi:hypothetical protein